MSHQLNSNVWVRNPFSRKYEKGIITKIREDDGYDSVYEVTVGPNVVVLGHHNILTWNPDEKKMWFVAFVYNHGISLWVGEASSEENARRLSVANHNMINEEEPVEFIIATTDLFEATEKVRKRALIFFATREWPDIL